MINWFVIFLYGFLLITAIFNSITQYKRKQRINAFICFQTAFILYYMFIPIMAQILIIFCPDRVDGYLHAISHADSYDLLNICIYTMLAYFIILVVYYVKRSSIPSGLEANTAQHNENEPADNFNRKVYHIAVVAGVFTLIVGAAAELYIADSLGGIFKAMAMGDRLRAFGMDRTYYIPQNRLFILILMVHSLASPYFFVYALRLYKHFSIVLLLVLSIFASTFFLVFNAGRLGVILFILTFLIDIIYRKTKRPAVLMGLLLVLGVFFLGALDDLFFYLSYGYLKGNSLGIISIVNEFSFPYVNLLNAAEMNKIYGLRWGVDFVSWIINVIPTKILNVFGLTKITSQYMFTTEYYSSISGFSGGIPTDILTLGIRQFGVSGIAAVGMLCSIICKCIDKAIDKIYSTKFTFMILRISSIMFIIVPYADLDSFARSRYDMLMVLLFSIAVSRLQSKTEISTPIIGNMSLKLER